MKSQREFSKIERKEKEKKNKRIDFIQKNVIRIKHSRKMFVTTIFVTNFKFFEFANVVTKNIYII
jgi:hypothetical protein